MGNAKKIFEADRRIYGSTRMLCSSIIRPCLPFTNRYIGYAFADAIYDCPISNIDCPISDSSRACHPFKGLETADQAFGNEFDA
jgi:hypothetical protein